MTFALFDCRLPAAALETLRAPFGAGQLAAGPAVAMLEQAMAARFPERHAVAVGDMTNGLALSLRLAGVGSGGEVLTLSFNCMSSTTPIAMLGASPSWVDVDPATATFDLESARRRLTGRTRALVVYHVSGYPADLPKIRRFCDDHGLPLIEDANNAFGAEIAGQPVGSFGDFTVFSLYANRQVAAVDGGIVLCRRAEDASRMRRLRRFGIDGARFRDAAGEIDPSADVPEIGMSSALNNVQASLGLASMSDVDARIERSRSNVATLAAALGDAPLAPVTPLPGAIPAYWTWLVRAPDRDGLLSSLKRLGVQASKLHHPNHEYSGFGRTGVEALPGTTVLRREMLAIPCGWWLDDAAIMLLLERINDALRNAG